MFYSLPLLYRAEGIGTMSDHRHSRPSSPQSRPDEARERIDEAQLPGRSGEARGRGQGRAHRPAPPFRWECPCQDPPVLLATYTAAGRLNIKVRDRYWHLVGFGQVQTICPRCAAEHILDLASGGRGQEAKFRD